MVVQITYAVYICCLDLTQKGPGSLLPTAKILTSASITWQNPPDLKQPVDANYTHANYAKNLSLKTEIWSSLLGLRQLNYLKGGFKRFTIHSSTFIIMTKLSLKQQTTKAGQSLICSWGFCHLYLFCRCFSWWFYWMILYQSLPVSSPDTQQTLWLPGPQYLLAIGFFLCTLGKLKPSPHLARIFLRKTRVQQGLITPRTQLDSKLNRFQTDTSEESDISKPPHALYKKLTVCTGKSSDSQSDIAQTKSDSKSDPL